MVAQPAPVRHALATQHPGLPLQAVARMRNLTYEVQLLDSGPPCTVLYNSNGREVRQGGGDALPPRPAQLVRLQYPDGFGRELE